MTYMSTVLADGAVGFWELAETSGTNAADQAGNSSGTFGGAGYSLAAVAGIAGARGLKAVTFSGTNGLINVPAVAANEVGDIFTVECWLIVQATGTTYTMFGGNGTTLQLALDTSSPPKLLSQKAGSTPLATSTSGVPNDGAWHHLAWTKNGATNHQYIDGVDVTGAVTNTTIATETVKYGIGFNSHGSNQFLNANICMVALYPSALTSTQIGNHYTLGTTAVPPTNTIAPAVTGSSVQYQVLSSTTGTWTDDGSGVFTYQWQRDNSGGGTYTNISAATLPTYTVQAGDYQCNLRCVVTDTDSGGAVSANSNAIGLATLAQRLGVRIGAT